MLVAGREIKMKRRHGLWRGLWHKQASKRQAHLGPRQLAGRLSQGHLSGVAAGDGAQQPLQGLGAAQPLQIPYQGKGSIRVARPTEPLTTRKGDLQLHRLGVAGKALELAAPLGGMAQGRQAGCEPLGIAKHGWQDGEVGHGTMPAFSDPSDQGPCVQWPLPQDCPNAQAAAWAPEPGPLRLGVLASGAGSNFEALVLACRQGNLQADVALLVVNNRACGAQQRAERLGVPCQLHDHRNHPSREHLDRVLVDSFQEAAVDLVVMAGWMRVVTPILIGAFSDRLINIHPSLLPSFRGLDAVGQALAAGVTLAGCTAHLVSEEVDAGKILVQAAVPVLAGDSHASLSRRIQVQEHRILPLAVALAAQG